MAAVLAAGRGAVLSHRSAAALHGLRRFPHTEVTAPTHRTRPGIVVHTSILPFDEITVERGIPVTTVPRTLLDLAAVLPAHQVHRAFGEAEMQRCTDHLSLVDMVDRYPGRRGLRTIKEILDTGPAYTRSDLEAYFLALARDADLPAPRVNSVVVGFECDCVWPDHRVVVEVDGGATHVTRAAFEQDRARDRTLQANGWRVIRATAHQLEHERESLFRDLRALLRFGPRKPA